MKLPLPGDVAALANTARAVESFGNILIVGGSVLVLLGGLFGLITGRVKLRGGRQMSPQGARAFSAVALLLGAAGLAYGLWEILR
ncbi:MAG: hypothetical protein BIFFINMI_01224 [Phycisphaerae bacterium]|nr:hypothetical protein [Phycisphaerae bacterium]